MLEDIIQNRVDPRRFAKQTDFIDCVRLLADIIDSYPYDKQIVTAIIVAFLKENCHSCFLIGCPDETVRESTPLREKDARENFNGWGEIWSDRERISLDLFFL